MSILRMLPKAGRIIGGTITFEGDDLRARSEKEMEKIRGRQIGLVPQDPAASLNPLMTAGQHLTELLGVHLGLARVSRPRRAPSSCSRPSGSRSRPAASTRIPTSCPAACASAS